MANKQHVIGSMDPAQQKLFVSYFKSLPEKPSTTIRFFNRTEFYTVHGPDALFVAKQVFRTTSFVKEIGSGNDTLESLNLNKSQFESLIRDLLLVKQYRVEVYTSKGNKAPSTWTLEYKGSPGNLAQFEELLFSNIEQIDGAAVLSVKYDTKNKVVGICLVDMVEHTFSLAEFTDDEHFTSLEGIIVQFGAKECIIPSDSSLEFENIKKVAERCGVLVTGRKKADFSTDGLVQDLNRLIKFEKGQQQNANAIPQMNLSVAATSLGAAIKYLELTSDADSFGQFVMKTLEHEQFVHLDSAAMSALNITANSAAPQSASHTILALLDKCRTSHGHRLIGQWIKQPLKDLNLISERHNIVELLVNETVLRQALYEEHLVKIPDFQLLSKKLLKKRATLQDCYRIYQGIEKLPTLVNTLETYSEDGPNCTLKAVIIDPLKENLNDMEKFQEMVCSTIDMSLVDNGEYLIKAEFDEDLQDLREKMEVLEKKMKKELSSVADDLSLEAGKSVKIDSNSQYGYFFRVTLKDEKVIRNNKKYIQLDANKAGVRFRSKKLNELNDEYTEIRDSYTKHQQSVVSEVIAIAVGYSNSLHEISCLLAKLDVLCSMAVVSACAPKPYIKPVMKPKGSGVLRLIQARHPCLEQLDSISYIPNDVDFNDESTFYVITGPNMGGKSTYIRSVGTVVLLAQIGCLVPCDEAEISIVDSILARVGANDSQIKGMSTFMIEMVETASILKSATKDSLIIIDELGRGTSTYEGCGIAVAITEYLAKEVKAFCLFATHFHELTRLSDEISTLKNIHVTAVPCETGLTLLYQVKPGACDQSFGIHVAVMARFPQHVVEEAKRKLSELEDYQSIITAESDVKKRKIIKEGEEKMKEVLERCKQLPIDNLSQEELIAEIDKMRAKVMEEDNPYLNLLINKSVPVFV
ncbi:DNA mismatch repair protein Msh2 [Halyomorpha halys]|uniref:DNA mismatch repair protein Msh2 n=1 Tax=Halyomorpha halys TaxID=286706 RepID=UPI0006D52053|nr:DNA mismatch repair protein Msh2 [Halyomorpha halys]